MSASIKQAVNQVRLTNVAYVRLQRKGKKFEIACYRNKVVNWRAKIENNIEEVLQIGTVFTNVSKGMLASSKDLIDAFGTADHLAVCREILDKGDVQVSEQERGVVLESMFRDVASIVVEKSINPENNRPYTISIIQNAMRQIHYSVNATRSAKSQALDVIRRLKDVMPIARANMLLRIICTNQVKVAVRDLLNKESGLQFVINDKSDSSTKPLGAVGVPAASLSNAYSSIGATAAVGTSDDDAYIAKNALVPIIASSTIVTPTTTTMATATIPDGEAFVDVLIDPEIYRRIEELVGKSFGSMCRVEVLQLRVASATVSCAPAKSSDAPEMEDRANSQVAIVAKDDIVEVSDIVGTNHHDEEDDEDDEDGDEDVQSDTVFGMVSKTSKKKQKKQKKVAAAMESDDDNDEGAEPMPTTLATGDTATDGTKKEATGKKGKKTKRIEKEAKIERELKALKLKERLDHEIASRPAVIPTSPAPSASSIVSASASTLSAGAVDSGASANIAAVSPSTPITDSSSMKRCNTCTGQFPDMQSYRNHFRSEWHNHNLKRKMKNLPIVESEDAFCKLSYEELEI